MSWLVRVLYFLFVVLLLRTFLKLLFPGRREASASAGAGPSSSLGRAGKKTVRDPQCGMYLEPSLALRLDKKGEVLYFCSETCRDRYLRLGT